MSEWRRVKNWGRRDGVEPGIIRAFQDGGFSVTAIGTPCDLLVGGYGLTHLVECKTNRAKLTPAQEEFRRTWKGSKPVVVRTPTQARRWANTWADRANRTRIVFPQDGGARDAAAIAKIKASFDKPGCRLAEALEAERVRNEP